MLRVALLLSLFGWTGLVACDRARDESKAYSEAIGYAFPVLFWVSFCCCLCCVCCLEVAGRCLFIQKARTLGATAEVPIWRRFLILYLVFLPFGLSAFLSWSTCGCMPVLCFLIVGIDNIASATENPCTSLPLRALAAGHANVVDVILRTKKSPSLTAILEMT